MNDTLTLTRRPGRIRRSEATAVAVAAVLFGLLVLLVSPLLRTASTVDQLDVDNRTTWPLEVSVRSESGGWTPVGIAAATAGTSFTEAPDPGERWQIRFAYGGVESITTLRRTEISDRGWSVTVPADLIEALEGVGMPPAPPRGT